MTMILKLSTLFWLASNCIGMQVKQAWWQGKQQQQQQQQQSSQAADDVSPFPASVAGGVDVYMERLRADPQRLPSAAQTVTFTQDGPLLITENPDVFKLHNELLGKKFPEDVVAEGKKAAKFFFKQFGLDFTNIDEGLFLRGNASMMDGAVSFSHFMLDPRGLKRMVTASNLFEATRFNNYVSDGGWRIFFHRDVMVAGRMNRVIPAGGFSIFGNYGVRIGVHADDTTITNSKFPGPVLDIHYESISFVDGGVVDCLLYNNQLGPGLARGVHIPRIDDITDLSPDTYWVGGNVLTFPGNVPFNVLTHEDKSRNN